MQQMDHGVHVTLRFLFAVLLVTAPMGAQALGLGRLVVSSGLDEPLNGEIELISPTSHELKTLKTSLAAREDFDIAGVERNPLLFDITYSVIQHANGQHFIKLVTHKPVREPFVHFLIEVEWSGGRLIREYSALLDPPQWVAGRPADIDVPETSASESAPVQEIQPLVEVPPSVVEESLPPIGSAEPVNPVADVPVAGAAVVEKPQSAVVEPVTPAETQVSKTEPAAVVEAIAPPAEVTFIDPVTGAASAQSVPVVAEAERTAPAVVSELAPFPAPEVPARSEAVSSTSSQYGPVKTGETLSRVASTLNVDKGLSGPQVMLALLRANPSAFFGNNVNNLKAGKILTVPEHETIAALPKAQAAKEFSAQYDAWQEYKLKVAGASRAVTVAESSEPKAVVEPEQKAAAKKPEKVAKVDKKPAASGKAVPLDLLKIVRANLEQELPEETTKTPGVETKKDAVEQRALTERVATLEEAIESKHLQNKEMRERVGKLQEQVKSTERLVDLENKDLALAQKQAAEKQVAEAKAAIEKAAQEKAAQEKAAEEKTAQEKAAAAAKAAKPAETTKPATDGAVAKKPSVAPAPVPVPAEEGILDGIVASVSENPLILALLAVLGVLAVGVGGLYAYRRRSASREFSESILSSNSLSGDASMEASLSDTSGQVAASDTSFLSDFSQGGMGNIHTDEVDPIAEAEVYLAYGRDEQAEDILKDAIVKDPVRQELKGKLLEIYFQRNDVAGFETLAEELYAALEGKGGKVWDKAEEMGRKLSPNNPMFRGGQPAARSPAAATSMLSTQETATALLSTQEMQLGQHAAPASPGLDFNLDFDNKPAPASASSLDMDFDMGMTDAVPASHKTSGLDMDFSLAAPSADSSSNLIDFNSPGMDFNSPGTSESSAGMDFFTSDTVTTDDNAIDFSSSGAADTEISLEASASEGALPGWDETTTKLDLAKAYIDMGDSEGARSILDEVMAEGNDSQKRQARDLAAQIAA